jgi:hypothetical protein
MFSVNFSCAYIEGVETKLRALLTVVLVTTESSASHSKSFTHENSLAPIEQEA